MGAVTQTLDQVEAKRLGELETTIERGMRTFVEVGQALAEIRDERLYRDSHDRFEDYCQERWAMSRPRAYQLIDAATVVGVVSTTVDTVPASEAVVRELAPLRDDPEKLRAAWQEAVSAHDGKPTAKAVQRIVEKVKPKAPRGSRPDAPARHIRDVLDSSNINVRDQVVQLCGIAARIRELLDSGATFDLEPNVVDDKESILAGLDAVLNTTNNLKRRLKNA